MGSLNIQTFLGGSDDIEARQYHILEGLKNTHVEFVHNRLYPTLADLVQLHNALVDIQTKMSSINDQLPKNLTGVDIEEHKLVFEQQSVSGTQFEMISSLIDWALPLVRKAIEEGREIYDFVDEHVSVDEVGILPMYIEEGYWLVRDHRSSVTHLLRYEASLFMSAQERYRTLKTRYLDAFEGSGLLKTPAELKTVLTSRYHDLPNPATFITETDIDFPFQETMLPVAKRKLMVRVFT